MIAFQCLECGDTVRAEDVYDGLEDLIRHNHHPRPVDECACIPLGHGVKDSDACPVHRGPQDEEAADPASLCPGQMGWDSEPDCGTCWGCQRSGTARPDPICEAAGVGVSTDPAQDREPGNSRETPAEFPCLPHCGCDTELMRHAWCQRADQTQEGDR